MVMEYYIVEIQEEQVIAFVRIKEVIFFDVWLSRCTSAIWM